MIIDCISDLHGFKPSLPDGDLLIVAGDLTARDILNEYLGFARWLSNRPYDKIVLIAGNHDGKMCDWEPMEMDNLSYLQDSGVEYKGLKIWGSPWTPTFYNWHFMKDRGIEIREKWDLIPDDIDILITHGPPHGILDMIPERQELAGCVDLRETLGRLKNLKLHVFGHIHEGYGQTMINQTHFVNASIMNDRYKPVNKPIRIIL